MAKNVRISNNIKHSEPLDVKKPEKLIDYTEVDVVTRVQNSTKMGADFGEKKVPKEAEAPNKRKYDENGNYVKHKNRPQRKKKPKLSTQGSYSVMKQAALSNPYGGGKRGK